MNALKDVWLPSADEEYEALLKRTRDIGADAGDLLRIPDQVDH